MPVRNNTNRVPYFKDCPKPLTFLPRNIIIIKRTEFACLAQPVEHAAVNRSVGGSSPSTGARKAPCERCFFLALFEDKNPARFARIRQRRNDTADTALDAIGTLCRDRYSVTSFLAGVRVPLGVPAESIFGGGCFRRHRRRGFFFLLIFFLSLEPRALNLRSLGGFVVLGGGIGCTSLTWEYCSPSFPSGLPPPLGKSAILLKCGIFFLSFLIKFESRIEIIKRRTE